MAKKQKVNLFLILRDMTVCRTLGEGLTEAGYNVNEYQTAREFLIDKRNYVQGIVFAELRLLGSWGTELVEQLAGEKDTFPVILLTNTADVPKAVKTGSDFLCGQWTIEALSDAIARTLSPDEMDERKLHQAFKRMTSKEFEVLELIAEGKPSREIAVVLGISAKTVEAHRARINDKTRANDVGELIRMWKAWQAIQ